MTLDVLRYEGEHRLKSTLGISVAFALLALLFVASAPLITTDVTSSTQFQQVMTELPQPFIEVRFFTSVNTSFAVTRGSRSYSPVNCNCTSRSTNCHSEYNKHATAK